MVETLTEPAHTLAPLDEQTTAALLSKCVQQLACVYVRPAGEKGGLAISGTVTGSEDSCLTLEFERLDRGNMDGLVGTVLDVTVEIDQVRYTFEAGCVDGSAAVESTTLRVRQPERMALADRRRSPRRRLQGRTQVSLTGAEADVDWHAQAVMLNLSTEGIACRLAEHDAERLRIGHTLCLAFCVGASATPLELNANVSNITEGGTPGQVVVGLAFIADEQLASHRSKLQQALRAAR
jgi:hypothetical protein